jgi:hypothetical protein
VIAQQILPSSTPYSFLDYGVTAIVLVVLGVVLWYVFKIQRQSLSDVAEATKSVASALENSRELLGGQAFNDKLDQILRNQILILEYEHARSTISDERAQHMMETEESMTQRHERQNIEQKFRDQVEEQQGLEQSHRDEAVVRFTETETKT